MPIRLNTLAVFSRSALSKTAYASGVSSGAHLAAQDTESVSAMLVLDEVDHVREIASEKPPHVLAKDRERTLGVLVEHTA